MKKSLLRKLAALGGILGAALFSPADAQQVGPPFFPPTLPPNTVVGRIQAGTGPAQAITLPQLLAALGGGSVPGGISGSIQYNNAGAFGGFTMAGDCTLSQPNITCTKTSGTAFGALATLGVGTGLTSSGGNLNLTTPVSGANGGTGVANTGLTVTLGASLTTTGAGAPTLAFPGSSFTYTFQGSSDTIVGRATTDTFTNKTYDTAGTGNVFKINGTQISSISGNTSELGSASGAFVSGNCVKTDANHNLVDAATTCASSGLTVGTTTVSGGSAGNLLYTDGSVLRASGGITWVGTGQQAIALGTITTNLIALNITGTWNAVGTKFDAPLFMNITNTASAAGSLLADLQVGGVSKFSIDKAGQLVIPGGVSGTITYNFAGTPSFNGLFLTFPNGGLFTNLETSVFGTNDIFFQGSAATGSGNLVLETNTPGGALILSTHSSNQTVEFAPGRTETARIVANLLQVANSTTAQALTVYNTTDSQSAPTNYERGTFNWTTTSNILTIGAQAGGTGTGRSIRIVGGSAKAASLYNFGVAPVTDTSATYSVLDSDQWLIFNGSGSITVTLPAASSYTGREITMKTIAAQTVVSASSNVAPATSATPGTAILAGTAGKFATLVSDGSNWIIMQSN